MLHIGITYKALGGKTAEPLNSLQHILLGEILRYHYVQLANQGRKQMVGANHVNPECTQKHLHRQIKALVKAVLRGDLQQKQVRLAACRAHWDIIRTN